MSDSVQLQAYVRDLEAEIARLRERLTVAETRELKAMRERDELRALLEYREAVKGAMRAAKAIKEELP